jgi:hypothetical protein
MKRTSLAAIAAALILAGPTFGQQKVTHVSLFGAAERQQIQTLNQQIAAANAANAAANAAASASMQAQISANNANHHNLMMFLLAQRGQQIAPQAAPAPAPNIYYIQPPQQQLPIAAPQQQLPIQAPQQVLPILPPQQQLPILPPQQVLPVLPPQQPLPVLPPQQQLGPQAPQQQLMPAPVQPLPQPQLAPAQPQQQLLPPVVGPPTGFQRYSNARPPVVTATITDRYGVTRQVPAAVWRAGN